MKRWLRVLIAVGAGFGIAMLIMTMAIYFGYTHAYASGGALYDVRILGIKIYELALDGEKYSGVSIGENMGIFCGICMAAAVIVEELIAHRKSGTQ